jgi:hypothetical protein
LGNGERQIEIEIVGGHQVGNINGKLKTIRFEFVLKIQKIVSCL